MHIKNAFNLKDILLEAVVIVAVATSAIVAS